MQGGFSFCGVDIGRLGLEYVPSIEDTYVYAGSSYDVSEETFEAHHGGYFYGTTVQPKIFRLRCMFQEKHINHGFLSAVESFFHRGKTGKLIFSQNPWLWYSATVVGIDMTSMVTYMNGFITITLKSYYPFGRCDYLCLPDNQTLSRSISENTALLSKDMTPSAAIGSLDGSVDLLLYNGGSEFAPCAIELAGNAGECIIITNQTTGQRSKFILFTESDTTDAGKTIISDALNGKTILAGNGEKEIKFLYHDEGFLELAPSFPIKRDIIVSWKNDSNIVSSFYAFDNSMIGKHIYLNGEWRKIIDVDDASTLTIEKAMTSSGSYVATVAQMNEIHIELGANASITTLNFIYYPTFK